MTRRVRGQFQFTIVELVVLAVSFAVTSLLVFLLGFYVGREVASEHAPLAAEVATLPGDVPALGGPASAPEAGMLGDAERVPAKAAPGPGSAVPAPPPRVAAPPRVPAPAPVAKPPTPPAPPSAARSETEPPPSGTYTVQVLATRNRAEAESMVAGLKRRGYGAFVMVVEDADVRWYRVRIGRYEDLESAQSMADRCRRDLGLKRAYVISY